MTPRPVDSGDRPARDDQRPDPSPIARALTGCGVILFGVFMLAVGLSSIPLELSPNVPRWLVGLVGLICLLAGAMALLPPGPCGLASSASGWGLEI